MMRIYQGTDEYHEKAQSIKEFINFHHLPKSLANRLQESFQHTWSYTNGIDMNTVRITVHGFKGALTEFPLISIPGGRVWPYSFMHRQIANVP